MLNDLLWFTDLVNGEGRLSVQISGATMPSDVHLLAIVFP